MSVSWRTKKNWDVYKLKGDWGELRNAICDRGLDLGLGNKIVIKHGVGTIETWIWSGG